MGFNYSLVSIITSKLVDFAREYYGFGNLSVIYPRFLGQRIVESITAHSLLRFISSNFSEVLFFIPGIARILSQEGLLLGSTYRQLLITWLSSGEKLVGMAS